MRNEAIIKSVHFKTFPETELPSLAEMAAYPTARKNKYPFIGVNLNMGTTSYWSTNPSVIKKQQYSFGRPITFFRFSFTSALYDIPMAYVWWEKFIADSFSRTTFKGDFTEKDWNETPELKSNAHNWVCLDDIIPSKFILAHDTDLKVAFIALDPERIGEQLTHDTLTDMGDDILLYKNGNPHACVDTNDFIIHPNTRQFLTTDFTTV
jgi:hypothetical protein